VYCIICKSTTEVTLVTCNCSFAENIHLLNLGALSKRYGISVEKPAHRAMQDVTMLCQVFQRIAFDLKLTSEGLVNEAIKATDFSKVPK
jgi:DNA polymerase III epsilon subunit-like protein